MAAKRKANGNGRSEGIERRRYVEKLPVPADHKTIERASKEMAKLIRDDESIAEERREAMADFKSRQNAIHEQQKQWADTVENGTRLADVPVIERLIVETNEIQVVRQDTGEVVSTRIADAQDRQEALFDEKPKKRGKRGRAEADASVEA